MGLSGEDSALVEAVRRDGIAVCHGVLSPDQIEAARAGFDAYCERDATSAERLREKRRWGSGGDQLGADPRMAAVYSHPRTLAIVGAIMGEPLPYLDALFVNRSDAGCAFPALPLQGIIDTRL